MTCCYRRDALVRAREEIEAAVNESPFFDTKLWAKGFERAWFTMWDTFQETGEASKFHIRVVPDKYGRIASHSSTAQCNDFFLTAF